MSSPPLDIVVIGLSITSSWGNGHATTYRALLQALAERGHRVLFLERDVPWYAGNRDLTQPPYARVELYANREELEDRFAAAVRGADLTIVGSFVPEGIDVIAWVLATAKGRTAFYDIDTPETLAALAEDRCEYLARALVPGFDLYLSFTGGATLRRLERELGARRARPLYCSVDPVAYHPEPQVITWDLGYMGTYCVGRQRVLDRLLCEPAAAELGHRFVVAGPLYPGWLVWPANVERTDHVAPAEHRAFYCRQRFTLNVTRPEMAAAGHAPSVRLFEAAACGVPIISDPWPGLETLFVPGREILIARGAADVQRALGTLGEEERTLMGERARRRVLAEHTAAERAAELERCFHEITGVRHGRAAGVAAAVASREPP
jgi:spore maturation protein CgeB